MSSSKVTLFRLSHAALSFLRNGSHSPNQIVGSCIEPTLSILFEQDYTDGKDDQD